MIKVCKWCESEFNLFSRQKKLAGGLINECPDCLEELGGDQSPPKYLGVASGDGKMASITLLAFEDQKSREKYANAWRNNSGQNKGKSCQLGTHLTSMSGMKFKKIGENAGNSNHKGKA
jgi:hypothetical protein